jgi:type VI secretion system secreted protein Hcp
MAYDAFLTLDGMTGESQKTDFVGAIEVEGFSFGAHNASSVAAGTGSGAGKASFSEFSFTKKPDSATAAIFLACCNGTHIGKGKVTLRKAGGTAPVSFLVIDFTQLFITSIQWGGSSGGDDTPTESVSLAFGSMQVTYNQQDAKGGSSVKGIAGWNVVTNSKM